MDDSTYTTAKLQSEARMKWTNRSGTAKKEGTESYVTNTGFALNRGSWDLITEGDKMINEKLEVRVVDNHYHIKVGCQETIVHDKKEALKWLGILWDKYCEKSMPVE